MSVNQFYKKQAKEQYEPLSFAKLVKEHGDHWQLYRPRNVKYVPESSGPDLAEYHRMRSLERGDHPRIEACAEIFARDDTNA
jgi:hypothetical protein